MIKNVRYLALLVVFLNLQANSFSQKVLDYVYRPPDVRFDNFPINNGNASQESTSILIDSKGFVWSGTVTGLYRFDGVRYLEYGVSRGGSEGFKGLLVTDIFEDSEGSIWIGTSEALNKLDPEQGKFKSYIPDSARKTGVSNFIWSINEDSDGLFWILTSQDIFSFDKKTEKFTKFQVDSLSWYPQNSLFFHAEQRFAEDSLGNKWFVTNRGLYRFKKDDGTFNIILPGQQNGELKKVEKVNCVFAEKSGNLWIGTSGIGLLKWNFLTDKPEPILISSVDETSVGLEDISTILTNGDGIVWSFGNGSFSKYDTEELRIKRFNINYKDRTVYEAPESNIWINKAFQHEDGSIWFLNNTAGLMFRFDPENEKLVLYRSPAFMVYQCILDDLGSFWFACIRSNLFRLVTKQIPYYSIYPVNNNAHVAQIHKNNVLEDKKGQMWFLFINGTYISKNFDITSSTGLERANLPGDYKITGRGFSDSKGNLWLVAQQGKILKYDPETKDLNELTPSYPSDVGLSNIPVICEDKDGKVWLANPCYGLYCFTWENDKLVRIMDFEGIPREQKMDMMMDFMIDSKNNFWILNGESFFMIKMPEKIIHNFIDYGDGIFNSYGSNIRIQEDPSGNIWLLNCWMGLFRYNDQENSFTKIVFGEEGPNTQYYDLLADRLGRIWIAHNTGISVYNPLDKTVRLIQTPKLQFDIQSYQTKSGQIIYVNNNQLYVFNELIPINSDIPPVYITRMFVNGLDYRTDDDNGWYLGSPAKLILPFNQNTFKFEFAALNYMNPDRNQYRYFMKGFDKDTIRVSAGQPAEYKQLAPGNYRFWVTGSNNDGIWNHEGTFIDIRIIPPWYESYLSYLAYLIVILSAIAGYVKIRTYRLSRDRVRLKAEIDRATAELNLKNHQLEETDRIKTHFFTDISHEIRTPLSLIAGPLESISKEEILSTRMAGMVALMKRNTERLLNLVDQLLDISRLDAGRMKINLLQDDIFKCLRILIYEFLSVAESKKISFVVDIPDKSLVTWFDRDKIEKIITNLLTNAFKYTPEEGTIICTVKAVSDYTVFSNPMLKIIVKDTGPGIRSEYHERIFDKFYRVDGHYESGNNGTGIGLSLVKGLVTLLHGEIKVMSDQGKGAEFSLMIPIGKDHLEPDEYVISPTRDGEKEKQTLFKWEPAMVSEYAAGKETNKLKILIVEDNDDLRNFLEESLSDEFNVITSPNGRMGMNSAFTTIPDLIISDIIMPDTDGVKMCKKIKNDERTSHIPIILLTAKTSTEDRLEGLRAAADDYLTKPFNMTELKVRISNLISIRNKLKLKYNKFNIPVQGDGMHASVDDRFMANVFRIINNNYRNFTFDVSFLQEEIGMSKTHLVRKLKILTGLSPGKLIHNFRLERAAEMLLNREGNITEIANSVGLSNPSYFTKSFRIYFGVSPKDYPKRHRILS